MPKFIIQERRVMVTTSEIIADTANLALYKYKNPNFKKDLSNTSVYEETQLDIKEMKEESYKNEQTNN